MKILKFGGSSLANAGKILHVSQVIKSQALKSQVVVVVSAMQTVTDSLIKFFQSCNINTFPNAFIYFRDLYSLHQKTLNELGLKFYLQEEAQNTLDESFGKLSLYVAKTQQYGSPDYDYIISFGERWSSILVAFALRKLNVDTQYIDSSNIIITSDNFGNAKAIFSLTKRKTETKLLPLLNLGIIPVVSGFFGSRKDKKVTILGRGGSDYTATILAYALNAKEVILWKEVNGIFNKDPKKDCSAQFYSELSYDQALAIAQNGAKVLHPEAMLPVAKKKIIVWVKNTFNPNFAGTKIWNKSSL